MTAQAVPILPPVARPSPVASKFRMPSLWQVLVIGYMTLGRSFAYLGIPPVFIGELFIARSLVQNHRRWIQRFIDDVFHMRLLATSVAAVVLWGIVELLRAYYVGKVPFFEAVKTCTFNYYPIVLPIGMAMGQDMTVADFLRFWRRFVLIYGVAMIAYPFLQEFSLPWNDGVPLFAGPAIGAAAPVSILALWPYFKDWKWKYPALMLSMLPVFYAPGRGTLLGLGLGLMCVALVSVQRVIVIVLVMGGLFVLASIVGPYLPASGGRGAENLDPIFGIARLVATFDEPAAARMLRDAGYPTAASEMEVAAGTADWRKRLWMGAIRSLDTFELQLLGRGHGADLSPYTPGGEELRTPHNFVVYAVFYTGAIGLGLFGLMLCAIVLRCTFVPDRNCRALLLAWVAIMSMMALVGNMFETPFAAIPFYLVTGVLLGLNYRGAGPAMMAVAVPPAPMPVPAPAPAPVAGPRRARSV